MKIENLAPEFINAQPILKRLVDHGFEAYFVGGSVRDSILGLPIHDVDIATSAYPEEIKQVFDHTIDTGIQHGTVTVRYHHLSYEVTTFRTESTYQDFRRPDSVTFVRSLKEDLKRRDFTINALAMDHNGRIIDLFDGIGDLNKRVIRAVGDPEERFFEDALRMMRAVRFQSQLDFKIEKNTELAILHHHELLKKIAVERIHEEFIKMMRGIVPSQGLSTFLDTNLFESCPDFGTQRAAFQKLTSLYQRSLDHEVAIWILIGWAFQFNNKQMRKMLKNWKTSNEIIDQADTGIELLQKILSDSWTPIDLFNAGKSVVLDVTAVASLIFNQDFYKIVESYDKLPIHSNKELAVNGKILIDESNFKPGPNLGLAINRLLQAVVAEKVKNEKIALLQYLNEHTKE